MTAIQGPAPGFQRHPEHRISIQAAGAHWQAKISGVVLADSSHAQVLSEAGYGEVVYFPSADVRWDELVSSSSETACPFKGRASYFRLASAPDGADVGWTYPATYNEARAIKKHVAFYTDRISIEKSDNQ